MKPSDAPANSASQCYIRSLNIKDTHNAKKTQDYILLTSVRWQDLLTSDMFNLSLVKMEDCIGSGRELKSHLQ